jgi:hypothetical protein
MKTKIEKKKKFDAVKYMRMERERVSKEIKGMTQQQELEYIKKKSKEFRDKNK